MSDLSLKQHTVVTTSRRPGGRGGWAPFRLPRIPLSVSRVLVPFSIFWVALVVFAAVFTPLLPLPSYEVPVGLSRQHPQWGEFATLLGTDAYGRSTIIRAMWGASASLSVSLISVSVALVGGILLGTIAGYLGKRTDTVVRVILDSALAFPPLVLLLAITAVLTPSIQSLSIGLAIVVTPSFARLARSATLAIREEAFIQAARTLGASHLRIIVREIIPNVFSTLYSYVFLTIATIMVAEGSLSFLGQGIRPPQPTWGGMINSGRADLATTPELVLIPSAVLVLTILALNIIGDRLQRGKK